jgi:hypothetical protein
LKDSFRHFLSVSRRLKILQQLVQTTSQLRAPALIPVLAFIV